MLWRFLSTLSLLSCFGFLAVDFAYLVNASDSATYVTLGDVLPSLLLDQVEQWVRQPGSVLGGLSQFVLTPLLFWLPLWVLCLVLALFFRILGRTRA